MALEFDTTMPGLMINRGIKSALAATTAITVYKGTQPSGTDIVNNWANYNQSSPDCLAHYTGANWVQQIAHSSILAIDNIPTTSPAFKSGEATWAIFWITNVTLASIHGSTLPSTSFIVIPCSSLTGNGVIRYIDPVFTIGVSKSITEAVLKAA
jgi:hypothetical protein